MILQDLQLLKKYIIPYKARLVAISSLAVICAFFEAINLGSLVPLLQMMAGTDQPGGTLWEFLSRAFSFIGIPLNFINLLFVMSILFIIGQCFLLYKKRMQANLWFVMSADLKKRIFHGILDSDICYHYSQKAGQFNDLLTRESEYASTSVYAVTEIVTYVFFILVYSLMLLYISLPMTLICLLVAGVTLFFLNTLIVRSKKLGNLAVETSMQLNEFVSERLNLVKLIKIFSTEPLENSRFEKITIRYTENNTDFMFNGIKIEIIFQIIIFTIAIAILYISTFVFQMPLALLLVFIFILIRLTDPLRQLNAQRHQLAGEMSSLEKIDIILTESDAGKKIVNGKTFFSGFSDSITFNDVSFSYTEGTEVLHQIDFRIPKNSMIALVGSSGGGKSTIVDLLIHLIEPESGQILVDATDLRDFAVESYHKKIGFVSQESYLFNDTVLNNICYGSENCDKNLAIDVAKIANAHRFIMDLPQGYDTLLGERGTKISGGQKQRIALARALYKKPDILILDEATSALDSESEKVIQEAISAIKHKYTIIAIAHRLSTIENADFIVVIEKGRVVETGTNTDLLKAGGVYAKYYNLQYRKEHAVQQDDVYGQ